MLPREACHLVSSSWIKSSDQIQRDFWIIYSSGLLQRNVALNLRDIMIAGLSNKVWICNMKTIHWPTARTPESKSRIWAYLPGSLSFKNSRIEGRVFSTERDAFSGLHSSAFRYGILAVSHLTPGVCLKSLNWEYSRWGDEHWSLSLTLISTVNRNVWVA